MGSSARVYTVGSVYIVTAGGGSSRGTRDPRLSQGATTACHLLTRALCPTYARVLRTYKYRATSRQSLEKPTELASFRTYAERASESACTSIRGMNERHPGFPLECQTIFTCFDTIVLTEVPSPPHGPQAARPDKNRIRRRRCRADRVSQIDSPKR